MYRAKKGSDGVPRMTPEEYLKFEEKSEIRHEFVDGEVFAMTGTTKDHERISINLVVKLEPHLRGTGCRVFTSHIKVHVATANCFYYPDLLVTCEQQEKHSGKDVLTSAPSLIIEILSRSTSSIDRREKRMNYARLDSLQEYILISQRRCLVECYRKQSDASWTVDKFGKGEELILHSMPGAPFCIQVDEIYYDVDISDTPTVQEGADFDDEDSIYMY
jgi:Uma2 family endonuclease